MKKLYAVVLLSAALSGCAGSRDISLRYAPDFPGVPAGTGKTITLAATEDARARTELGVLTGFTALLRKPRVKAPGQDIPAWVSGAIAAELREAGFRTVPEGEELRLETRLKEFHARGAAEIRLEATLYRDGEVLFTKEYESRSPVPFMGGTGGLEESFQQAMRYINLRLVYDIIGKI